MSEIKKVLDGWITDPKRRYADGLALFEACATPTLKQKYGQFLKDAVPEEQTQFSQAMGILTNKLVAISQMMVSNPKYFEDIKLVVKNAEAVNSNPDVIAQEEKIVALNSEIEVLKEKLETETDNKDELQSEVEDKEAELEELKEQLEELKKIQIVSVKDLPPTIKKLYNRNQAITPLMAAIFNEMANTATTEEKRKELREELCKLDDERRVNWDKIDEWAEGKEQKIDTEEKMPDYDNDPVIAGMQMARRIIRLKENIKRSEKAVEGADKENIRKNAEKRLNMYKKELDDLEKLAPKEEKGGDAK